MNTIFLTGKVRTTPDLAYTPKGRKIATFSLLAEIGDFSIQVVCSGDSFPSAPEALVGNRVLVSGELTRAKLKTGDVFKVKARKIIWMEE